MTDFEKLRNKMVDRQIAARGVRSPAILDAMGSVPREAFVPADMQRLAYDDAPLPIGARQTISQPYIVALMLDALALEGTERVLDIGTGSGYAAALLGRLAAEVVSIERIEELAASARATLDKLGCKNVEIVHGDGSKGWPDRAPYDAIVVAASGPDVPESLKRQLSIGGRLVMPIGASRDVQRLVRVTRRTEDRYDMENLTSVRFVPLLGDEAWASDD